jgi:hypothetical protein
MNGENNEITLKKKIRVPENSSKMIVVVGLYMGHNGSIAAIWYN